MDLLFKAYSQSSDEEPEPEPEPGPKPRTGYRTTVMHPPKRHKPDNPQTIQRETSIPGRYISKRERTQAASVSDTNPNPNPAVVASPVLGSIADSNLPHKTLSYSRHAKRHALPSQVPKMLTVALQHHTKAVNAVNWSSSHVYSSPSCFCWDGSNCLHLECVEQRSEIGTFIQIS
uniref:Uncharacterized protein n=1 Tax=Rhizophora mucronata TaxID=61149 RepID=A0A2P2K2Y1_RHIMU